MPCTAWRRRSPSWRATPALFAGAGSGGVARLLRLLPNTLGAAPARPVDQATPALLGLGAMATRSPATQRCADAASDTSWRPTPPEAAAARGGSAIARP